MKNKEKIKQLEERIEYLEQRIIALESRPYYWLPYYDTHYWVPPQPTITNKKNSTDGDPFVDLPY